MRLIPITCSSCGASLEIDAMKEFAFCVHCGNKLMVQVADYKIEVEVNNKMQIESSRENLLKRAYQLVEMGQYVSAQSKFYEIINKIDAHDVSAWAGIVKINNWNFNYEAIPKKNRRKILFIENIYRNYFDYEPYKRFCQYASDIEKERLDEQFKPFYIKCGGTEEMFQDRKLALKSEYEELGWIGGLMYVGLIIIIFTFPIWFVYLVSFIMTIIF